MRELIRSQLVPFLRTINSAKTRFGVVAGLLIFSSFFIISRFEETRASHTDVIPTGAFHACNVVGQTEANSTDAATSGAPNSCNGVSSTADLTLFNKDAVDNGPIDRGLSAPAHAVFGGGYLWVTDSGNHRVLGFAVNGSNVLNDRIADVVLTGNGQTDATALIKVNTAVTSQTGFNNPAGLAYDSTNNRLYVVDQGNNRVLVFAATFSNGMNASYVLGQSNFSGNSTGTTQSTLNMSSSSQRAGAAYYNNLLFVADPGNSRVLVFNTKSLSNGMNAAAVYGQTNFTSANTATSQSGMDQPAGVATDSGNSRVIVADQNNNRVLVHDLAALYSVVNVGASGGIQRTTNGGTTWSSQTSGVAVSLNGVYFTDSNTGWTVGNSGTILVTTNGGTTWTAQTSGTSATLNNVFFADANTGWVTGNSGTILKTTNGGTTWTAQTSGTANSLGGVFFTDSNTGWVAGGSGTILKTTNGGTTWTAQTSGTSQDMGKLSFVDANTGWAVANAGVILKTTNGGTTWTAQTSGTAVRLVFPHFVDSNTGWIVGGTGTILKTTNGGTTWTAQTSGTAENLWGIGFIDGNIGWATGDNSTILKTTNGGTTWTAQTSAITQALGGVAVAIGINGPNALNVLGQANFTSKVVATSQAGMRTPQGVAYDTTGKLVFVADAGNHRLLALDGNTATIANGENAANVLGQTDFTSAAAAITQAGLSSPTGLAYDSTNKLLYGGDTGNNRVTQYDVNAISNGESAADCLGQLGASDACVFTKGTANNRPNARGFNAPRGAVVGNSKLFVSDTGNNRVLVYNLDSNGQLADRVADNVLGQASLHSGTGASTTSTTLSSPRELAYDSTNNRLFVYDYSNNRVLIYNVATIADGQAAANVLCQVNFTSSSTGVTQSTCNFAVNEAGGMQANGGLAWDSANSRLFISDGANARVLVFNLASGITDGMNASNVIGQANFTANSCAFTQAGMCNPGGLAYDSGNTRLFVADITRSGVLMYNLASGVSNGMNASAVLGQANYTTSTLPASVTAGNLAWPQGLAYDGSKYLFVTTMSTQQRIMAHDVTPATLSNGQNASGVIGQASFDGASANASLTGVGTTPSGMYYDTNINRLYLADRGNNRVMAYDLARVTTSSLSGCTQSSSCSPGTIASEDSQFTLSYSVASGSLPTGLSLNATTGVISGTPTGSGTSSFSIAATDTASGGFYTVGSQKALTLTVTAAPVTGGSSPAINPAPAAATNISGSYNSATSAITLTFTKPADADLSHCELWRNEGGATAITGPRVVLSGCASPYAESAGIKANTTYLYQLVSVDNAGSKTASQEVPVATTVAVTTVQPVCGNSLCEAGESTATCVQDCPAPHVGAPKLELTLSVEVLPKTLITATAAPRSTLSLALALSLSLLMLGAFMIHTHTTGTQGNPLNFFAIFPLLFTSSSQSYMYLRKCGPEACGGSHFTRHTMLKHFGRASLAATAFTGVMKLFMVFVLSSVIVEGDGLRAETTAVHPEDRVRVTTTVKNTGDASATNVLLNIPTPAGTAFANQLDVDAVVSTLAPQNGALSVSLGNIAAAATRTVRASYEILPAAVALGTVRITVSTSASEITIPVVMDGMSLSITARPPVQPLGDTAKKAQPKPEPEREVTAQPEIPTTVVPESVGSTQVSQPATEAYVIPEAPAAPLGAVKAPVVVSEPSVPVTEAFIPLQFGLSFNQEALTSAGAPGDIAGQVPIAFAVAGPVPPGSVLIEAVVRSEPQVFTCPIEGFTFRCNVSTVVEPGTHTLFAQAADFQGERRRISEVVSFSVNLPACFDAADNDGDGLIDYPQDPGCNDRADNDELEPIVAAVAPILPEPVAQTVASAVSAVQQTKVYQVLDKKIINNPTVEKANVQIAAPVIVVTAAANAVASVATTGMTLASLFTYLQGFVTQPLLLFTRRRRKEWGVVYSSLTKLPVDLAVVRLFDNRADRLIQTRVTDKQGRYLLLTDPGAYRLEVQKAGFTFPSAYLRGKNADLDFTDLYTGGPVTVASRGTPLARPIPVDPVEKTEAPADIRRRQKRRAVQRALAYSGPVFAVVSVAITPTLTTTSLLALQFILLGVFKRFAAGKKPHAWATVRDAKTGAALPFAVARIFDATYNKLLETQITDKNGHYAFLVGRGTFYITVDKSGYSSYRSEAMDFTRPEIKEIVKRDVKLEIVKPPVNGLTNGGVKMNGRTNGSTNGQINGRTNGQPNGKTNGKMNGQVRGRA